MNYYEKNRAYIYYYFVLFSNRKYIYVTYKKKIQHNHQNEMPNFQVIIFSNDFYFYSTIFEIA